MVVGNRLSLFGWESTECRPQAVVRGFQSIGCGPSLRDVGNRRRSATLGTDDVNRLVVRNRDKPSLDVGAVGEAWISPQGGEKGLRPGVIGVWSRQHSTAHPEHGRSMLRHDLFKRPFIVINLVDDGTEQNVRSAGHPKQSCEGKRLIQPIG